MTTMSVSWRFRQLRNWARKYESHCWSFLSARKIVRESGSRLPNYLPTANGPLKDTARAWKRRCPMGSISRRKVSSAEKALRHEPRLTLGDVLFGSVDDRHGFCSYY